MDSLSSCCQKEAERSLRKHRHVATCDVCGNLVLGYDDDADAERTLEELTNHQISFQTGRCGRLRIVAYKR